MLDTVTDVQGKRVFVGVTGSIAAYKAVELVRELTRRGAQVRVAMTRAATEFVQPLTFEALTGQRVLVNLFDASDGEIEHVESAHQVDVVVVAPATANALARFAAGLADDVVAATVLATAAPVVVAPAMESGMWLNQATVQNVARLQARGVSVVPPGSGALASGRSGIGRFADIEVVADAVAAALSPRRDFAGAKVLITAGPTYERLDPVRVLSNRSTGSMGIALAAAAAARGAEVTLVLGPTHLSPPAAVETVRVESAVEMLAACEAVIDAADVLIAAAAVSDFRPADPQQAKLKRSDGGAHSLALVENPDVLATLASRRRGGPRPVVVVGFAAETEAVEANARGKLVRKRCDLVIGNVVGPGVGFGAGDTSVVAVSADAAVPFGPASKRAVAEFVLDQVTQQRGEPKR